MHEIKLRGDPTSYWIKQSSDEFGRFKLYTRDPLTDAPVETGKMARADGKGYQLDNGAHGDSYARTIVVDSNGDQQGASAPLADNGSRRPDVLQLESSSDAGVAHEQVDGVSRAKKLAESKGFSFPDPPFLRENREYQELRNIAYKNIAERIEHGDKMHHVTQVYIELRDILGKRRDAIQLRDAMAEGLYKLDIGQSQYLLHTDWRNPLGVTHKDFSFPSRWRMPWLKWKGWKEVPAKYQNYFNLIEDRRVEFEKQVESYAKNPPRSYNDVVEFRSRRQKELDDIVKKYVEDKRLRRQQYVWRRNGVAGGVTILAAGIGAVYSVERIVSMFSANQQNNG